MISFNNIGNLGRLANQMFQYASLKGIARNRGYEFTIPPEQVFGQNDPLVKESSLNMNKVNRNKKKFNTNFIDFILRLFLIIFRQLTIYCKYL